MSYYKSVNCFSVSYSCISNCGSLSYIKSLISIPTWDKYSSIFFQFSEIVSNSLCILPNNYELVVTLTFAFKVGSRSIKSEFGTS